MPVVFKDENFDNSPSSIQVCHAGVRVDLVGLNLLYVNLQMARIGHGNCDFGKLWQYIM
jgi:hypothetical protein